MVINGKWVDEKYELPYTLDIRLIERSFNSGSQTEYAIYDIEGEIIEVHCDYATHPIDNYLEGLAIERYIDRQNNKDNPAYFEENVIYPSPQELISRESIIITDFSKEDCPVIYSEGLVSIFRKKTKIGVGKITNKWEVISTPGMDGATYVVKYNIGDLIDIHKDHKGRYIINAIDGPGGVKHWINLSEAPVFY